VPRPRGLRGADGIGGREAVDQPGLELGVQLMIQPLCLLGVLRQPVMRSRIEAVSCLLRNQADRNGIRGPNDAAAGVDAANSGAHGLAKRASAVYQEGTPLLTTLAEPALDPRS